MEALLSRDKPVNKDEMLSISLLTTTIFFLTGGLYYIDLPKPKNGAPHFYVFLLLVLDEEFVTWTFRIPPKRRLSILLNFFFPLIKLFLTFVVFAKTGVTMRFRAKNVGYSTGLSQVCATSCWWPCGADGRTDGRSRDYYVTTKISWLDTGLIGFQICLVTRWRAMRAGSADIVRLEHWSLTLKIKTLNKPGEFVDIDKHIDEQYFCTTWEPHLKCAMLN